ncbi:MAG: hypothetical protein DKINENOH_04466 [bacterium]|nr:hypothetical protein [bacterium]
MSNISKLLLWASMCLPLSACMRLHAPATDSSLVVMSFNIRLNTPDDGENAWPHRQQLVANTIQFHQADLIGLQEALNNQLADLSALLPGFAWLGVGRDDGREKGEYSAVLYRTDRFVPLRHGTFWLSPTPEQPGSLGWDAAITRIVTWAQFKDRRTNAEFYLYNTHFDHIGEQARVESAKLLLDQMQRRSVNAPVIVTGDFNATADSPVYQVLTGNGAAAGPRLQDARHLSRLPHYGPDWTFHGFGRATERPGIDYIFVNSRCSVLRHGFIADACGDRFTSDHFPVLAEIVLILE